MIYVCSVYVSVYLRVACVCIVCVYVYICVYMRCARVFGYVGYIFVCVIYACMYSLLGRLVGNVLQLIFLRDFVEGVISWLLGGRLSICHQIQAFQ